MPPAAQGTLLGLRQRQHLFAAMRRLLAAAEAAKVELSSEASTSISTPSCGDLDMQGGAAGSCLGAVAAPARPAAQPRRCGDLPDLECMVRRIDLPQQANILPFLPEWHKLLTQQSYRDRAY